MSSWTPPPNHWNPIGHFYSIIPMYEGDLYKYQGIATEGNISHLREIFPDGVLSSDYIADRVKRGEFELRGELVAENIVDTEGASSLPGYLR
jgi:hypothetical protein